MDIETVKSVLHPGLEIKNYKELCSLLNEKQKTGESKQIQLSNWQCYFSYTKKGHKFIIGEIFDIPKEKIDGRSQGNHSLFTKDIADNILCAVCSRLENRTNSRTKWIKITGLANENYGVRKDILELSGCDALKPTLNDFYYYGAGASVKTYLKSALNYLEKNNLASVSVKYTGISRFSKQELDELLTKYEEDCKAIEDQVKLCKEVGESTIDKLKEKYFMTFEDYLSRQPYDEESTDLMISYYNEEEYSKLMREVAEEFNYNLKTVKGREETYKVLLCRKNLRRLYSSITVVPNLDNVPASYCQITKEKYAEHQKALNQRVYEHLISLTEERHKRIYEKWQQDIQQELSHMKMKIGSPQPRMTKAYEAGYVMAETVSLSNRMKAVDALIKI